MSGAGQAAAASGTSPVSSSTAAPAAGLTAKQQHLLSLQETAGMKAESHRLERLFHELDTNKDGRIDIHELFQGLKRLGYAHISEEQVEVSAIFGLFSQGRFLCYLL